MNGNEDIQIKTYKINAHFVLTLARLKLIRCYHKLVFVYLSPGSVLCYKPYDPYILWKIKDPAFIKQSVMFAITKLKEWIIEQIT